MRFEQIVAAIADEDPVEVGEAGGRLGLLLERGADVEVAREQQHRVAVRGSPGGSESPRSSPGTAPRNCGIGKLTAMPASVARACRRTSARRASVIPEARSISSGMPVMVSGFR